MIFIINLTRGQMRFLTCVARVTCLVLGNVRSIHIYHLHGMRYLTGIVMTGGAMA